MPLTHLEYDQLKCAINAMEAKGGGNYGGNEAVPRDKVLDLLLRYTADYPAPNPHPAPQAAITPGSPASTG